MNITATIWQLLSGFSPESSGQVFELPPPTHQNALTIGATNWYACWNTRKQGQQLNRHGNNNVPICSRSLPSELETFGEPWGEIHLAVTEDFVSTVSFPTTELEAFLQPSPTIQLVKDYRTPFPFQVSHSTSSTGLTGLQTGACQ